MTRIVRLTNPAAFERAEVQDLFQKAFETNALVKFEDATEELVLLTADPLVAMLIGAEKGKLAGLSIAILPHSRLAPLPAVYHFYSGGSAKLREALIDATVDFFLQAGYTRFWATNMTGDSDEAYVKLFRKAGKAERVCSMLVFKIG
jgi:hypothetical protein